MNYFSSIILGLVQGLTEFLPVSSSGHLVLMQKLLPNFTQPGVMFDVILHFGTLFSVVFYFRKRILSFDLLEIRNIAIATMPAVVIGFAFREILEKTFSDFGIFLGIQFIITAYFCFQTDLSYLSRTKARKKKISPVDALLMGIMQAFAILPAISRSGSTIFMGVKRRIDKAEVAEFSFLMSIPVIIGANILEFQKYKSELTDDVGVYFIGFLAALISGYASIYWTLKLLKSSKFKYFGVYTLVLGGLIIITSIFATIV